MPFQNGRGNGKKIPFIQPLAPMSLVQHHFCIKNDPWSVDHVALQINHGITKIFLFATIFHIARHIGLILLQAHFIFSFSLKPALVTENDP